jgi:hypothetical protein
MRRVTIAACSFVLAASFSVAASQATEPGPQATAAQANLAPTGKVDQSAAKEIGSTCLKSTGSRIPTKAGQCVNAPGVVYTHKQLQTTGKTDTAGALRNLSPSLTISH